VKEINRLRHADVTPLSTTFCALADKEWWVSEKPAQRGGRD
jgi:hypothetical protein